MPTKYTWTPPRVARGDLITYRDMRGRERSGTCQCVLSTYDDSGRAIHRYFILPDKRKYPVDVVDSDVVAVNLRARG